MFDKISISPELSALQSFGFTHNEGLVYVALTAIGPSTAGPIVRKVGLHRQFVYSALERLETQGFVSHVVRNRRKVFNAARPELLLERELKRVREIESVVPLLRSLIPRGSDQLHIEVLKGQDEFIRRLLLTVDSAARGDRIIRTIAAVRDVDVYEAMGSRYTEYVEHARRRKVKKLVIAPTTSASEGYTSRLERERGTELRFLPSGMSSPTATIITEEMVAFDVFGSEVVSIVIWNKTIAKSFVEHFHALWGVAKRSQK